MPTNQFQAENKLTNQIQAENAFNVFQPNKICLKCHDYLYINYAVKAFWRRILISWPHDDIH